MKEVNNLVRKVVGEIIDEQKKACILSVLSIASMKSEEKS